MSGSEQQQLEELLARTGVIENVHRRTSQAVSALLQRTSAAEESCTTAATSRLLLVGGTVAAAALALIMTSTRKASGMAEQEAPGDTKEASVEKAEQHVA